MLSLVLGPVRSGKSARAAALARASGKAVLVAATLALDPADEEMVARVERHRRDRPTEWDVREIGPGEDLLRTVRDAPADRCVLLDALGTWLAGEMLALGDERCERDAVGAERELDDAAEHLRRALVAARADAVVVAEEAGWGVVPASAQGRIFRDVLGRATRQLARDAGRVELVVAGYAVDLRALGHVVDEA